MASLAEEIRVSLELVNHKPKHDEIPNDNTQFKFNLSAMEGSNHFFHMIEMPRDKFIEELMYVTNNDTDALQQERQLIFERVKVKDAFPGGELIKRRKPQTDTSESLESKLARDCYSLFKFLHDGDIETLYDVLNAKAKRDQLDCSSSTALSPSVSLDTLIVNSDSDLNSLQGTVKATQDSIEYLKEAMQSMKVNNDKEIETLRIELNQKQDDHARKREATRDRNNRIESEIREDISNVKKQCSDAIVEMKELRGMSTKLAEDYETLNKLFQKICQSLSKHDIACSKDTERHAGKLKQLDEKQAVMSRELNQQNRHIDDIRHAQQKLKEPIDASTCALKSEQKRMRSALKDVTQDCDNLNSRTKSTEASLVSIRKQMCDMDKRYQTKQESYASALKTISQTSNTVGSNASNIYQPLVVRLPKKTDKQAVVQKDTRETHHPQATPRVPESPVTVPSDVADGQRPTTSKSSRESQNMPIEVISTNRTFHAYQDEHSRPSQPHRTEFIPFYIGNINPDVDSNTVKAYLTERNIRLKYIKLFESKKRGTGNGAKVVVNKNDCSKLTRQGFLPRSVYVREWKDNGGNRSPGFGHDERVFYSNRQV